MLRPRTTITFTSDSNELTFNFCNEWETDESYEHLTDTARIVVPRKLSFEGTNLFAGTEPLFRRGDRVKIEAGYFPNSRVIFEGYIKYVHAKIPIEVEVEDSMYLLKQFTFKYPEKVTVRTLSKKGKPLKHPKITSANITLKELMDYIWHEGEYADILHDLEFKILDNVKLGQFRVSNATPAKALEVLKREYGIFSYFVDNVLHVGFANNAADTIEETFVMEEVVINSQELEYQTEDDVKIKVKAISMNPDNTKTEVEVGDPDGEQKTIHKYNMDEDELKEVAEKWIKEFKYTGLRGELETFGEPYVRHGDRAKIVSKKFPEMNGTYLIKGVKRKKSVGGGFRQFLTLGIKVA